MIVIGASAGGIQALQELLAGLPCDFPATILIVMHTAAEDGHLAEVLARCTDMPTRLAEHNMPIAAGQVYVAPPDHHLIVVDSRVMLWRGPKVNRHRPAIDPLFESTAKVFGKRVVGVVLTGYLDDGTAGLARVKAEGGIAIVQDPQDAVAPNIRRTHWRTCRWTIACR